MLSYTIWVMLQDFANWKILWTYISVAGFISRAYLVVKCKVFLLIQNQRNDPFLDFFRTIPPKYCLILQKWSELVPNKANTLFQKSFKILNFGSNGPHPKFTILVHFGTQFTARKPKILQKTRFSAQTVYRPTYLGISNNVSLKSQKSHIILVKLSKKTCEGANKLGLNCPWSHF